MIDLEHQEVVSALGPDLHGDVLLAAHRIQRHDAALPVQGLQQLRDRDDLIRLAVDRALAQRQSLFAGPGAGSDRLGRQVWPSCVAERVLAAVTRNDYGVLDNLVRAICPALGETGVAHLKARLTAAQAKRPTTDRFDGRSYALRAALQDIADAEGNVDAYIALVPASARQQPGVAAEIGHRLLKAGRAEEALAALEPAAPKRHGSYLTDDLYYPGLEPR